MKEIKNILPPVLPRSRNCVRSCQSSNTWPYSPPPRQKLCLTSSGRLNGCPSGPVMPCSRIFCCSYTHTHTRIPVYTGIWLNYIFYHLLFIFFVYLIFLFVLLCFLLHHLLQFIVHCSFNCWHVFGPSYFQIVVIDYCTALCDTFSVTHTHTQRHTDRHTHTSEAAYVPRPQCPRSRRAPGRWLPGRGSRWTPRTPARKRVRHRCDPRYAIKTHLDGRRDHLLLFNVFIADVLKFL